MLDSRAICIIRDWKFYFHRQNQLIFIEKTIIKRKTEKKREELNAIRTLD